MTENDRKLAELVIERQRRESEQPIAVARTRTVEDDARPFDVEEPTVPVPFETQAETSNKWIAWQAERSG